MKIENRTPLTLLEACTLMARETVSLLEGFDEVPDSAVELLDTLTMVSAAQDLGDGGALLAWVSTEMENTRRFAETGSPSQSLVKLDTPFPIPDPAMQIDMIWALCRAMAQQPHTFDQWQTMLNAAKTITQMDDLEDMLLNTYVPSGGFLTIEGLHAQLEAVRAALSM